MIKTDVLIIGGGTSGIKGAIALAKNGKKVIVAEPSALGGTCLNVGCIPTKAMLQASEHYHSLKRMSEFGISIPKSKLNFKKLMSRVTGIVSEGQSHLATVPKMDNITLLKAKATFLTKNTVKVGSKTIQAKNIIISTGAKNFCPPVKGLGDTITNENIFSLTSLPQSLITIGGGYIAMEFATFFSRLGVKVTVIERSPRILGQIEEPFTTELQSYYEKNGVTFITGANIIEVKKERGKQTFFYNDITNPKSKVRKVSAHKVLMACGRISNTKSLQLEKVGIATSKRGSIIVDKLSKTSIPHIYAVGDCTDQLMFAHSAKREMNNVVNQLLNEKPIAFESQLCPWAVFTDPPISGVGKMKGDFIKVLMKRAGRTRVMGEQRGFLHIYHTASGKINGATIMGVRADDLIHEITALMVKKGTLSDIRKTIHVHPTVSEVFEHV